MDINLKENEAFISWKNFSLTWVMGKKLNVTQNPDVIKKILTNPTWIIWKWFKKILHVLNKYRKQMTKSRRNLQYIWDKELICVLTV